MDLIYTNASREDKGVLLEYEMDMAFGSDENDFECTVPVTAHCCEANSMLYIEGTEYGGIVDEIGSNSETKDVIYYGRTWHGVLNSKVLEPDNGEDYLVCSGEANSVIGALLQRVNLTDLFTVSESNSELDISGYKMNRYIKAYDGIRKMLASVGGKLRFLFQDGKVVLSAEAIHDYTQDEEFNSDLVAFNVNKAYNTVNHLICLGKGELAERTVLHLYADAAGNISKTQTLFGMAEITDVYDHSSVESAEELEKGGIERLQELCAPASLNVDFDGSAETYDVADIVGAFDNVTNISITAAITKKIVTVKNGKITIEYKVGE